MPVDTLNPAEVTTSAPPERFHGVGCCIGVNSRVHLIRAAPIKHQPAQFLNGEDARRKGCAR